MAFLSYILAFFVLFDLGSFSWKFLNYSRHNSKESIGDSPKEEDDLRSQGVEKGLERRESLLKK